MKTHRRRATPRGVTEADPLKRGLVPTFGPGRITGVVHDGLSGIAAYSQASAHWVGHAARAGGEHAASPSPWLLSGIVVLLLVANTINPGVGIGAMGCKRSPAGRRSSTE